MINLPLNLSELTGNPGSNANGPGKVRAVRITDGHMRTLEELDLVPAWVNPDHLVATAIHVMQGHKINALAVISGSGLEGLITLERAQALPRFAKVETIVQPMSLKLDVSTSIRSAAKQFIDKDATYGAVYDENDFKGLVTTNMLLREIGQSWDPLTNLAWSNRLRDWGTEELESGHEVTIVFIDIDDFGSYNKRHGHIVGDTILKLFANRLREIVDRHNDILVRYGGDEFVIGTRLDRYAAERRFAELADLSISIEEVPEDVTVTVGFAGGMRSHEREHAHVASMLDNLINLASQDCTSKKQLKQSAAPADPEPSARAVEPVEPVEPAQPEQVAPAQEPQATLQEPLTYDVRLVSLDEEDPNAPVAVTLRLDGVDGTSAALPDGRSLMLSVAQATAKAIERVRPGVLVSVTDTAVDSLPDGEKSVTIVGSCTVGGQRHAIFGTRRVNRDVYRAVAEAVAEAYVSLKLG